MVEKQVMLTPSKITAWLECEHYLTLKINDELRPKKERIKKVAVKQEPNSGLMAPPEDFADMLRKKGDLHEQRCLSRYKETFPNSVFEVPERNEAGYENFAEWVQRIGNPMEENYSVIFQMPFIHEGIRGVADFLLREEYGNGKVAYEPVDSKLSRTGAKQGHLLQLLFYAEAVEAKTGIRPRQVHVLLGSGEMESFNVRDYWWYWKRLQRQIKKTMDPTISRYTAPEKCSHCGFCEYHYTHCRPQWEREDSLIFLSGIRKSHQEALHEVGIETLTTLASLNASDLEVSDIAFSDEIKSDFLKTKAIWAAKTGKEFSSLSADWRTRGMAMPEVDNDQLFKLWRQARLQTIAEHTKEVHTYFYDKIEMEEKALSREGWKRDQCILYLPETTEHDIYLDFEGHPFWEIEEGLIFLFGFIEKEENEWKYVAHWAHDKAEEKRQATSLIDYFYKKFQEHPETRIYHYNHTERALLSDITEETDSMSSILSVLESAFQNSPPEKERLEVLEEQGVFVDLLAVARNSMQTGFRSFSLKEMEKLAGFRRGQEANIPPVGPDEKGGEKLDSIDKGAGAVFEYELYANAGLYGIAKDETRLARIARYNRDDVVATRDLHEWLLQERKNESKLPDETLTPDSYEETYEASETQIERERLQEIIVQRIKEHRNAL